MSALLNQLTIIQDNDLVSIHHSAEPMSNHNNRLTLYQFCNSTLNQNLVLWVKGRCCLIKQNNRCVLQKRAGNGNPLTLTTGKSAAVLSKSFVLKKLMGSLRRCSAIRSLVVLASL